MLFYKFIIIVYILSINREVQFLFIIRSHTWSISLINIIINKDINNKLILTVNFIFIFFVITKYIEKKSNKILLIFFYY